MIVTVILLGATLFLVLISFVKRYNESYWKKRGVVFYKGNGVAGPLWSYLIQDRALFQIFEDLYKQYPNEPAVGLSALLTPALYVRDLQNLQHIMQLDFHSFSHRGVEINVGDTLAENLLFLNGAKWKLIRQQVTPLFTAAKMKNMFHIIDKSAQDFVVLLKNNPQHWKFTNLDTLTTFCCAAFGAAVFGIGTESTFDSPFLKMVMDAFKPTKLNNVKFAITNTSEWLSRILQIKFFKQHEDFFIKAIKQVIRNRQRENVNRHDFADICVSLQRNGKIKDTDTGLELNPTDELLAAQAFFFYVAGAEPTATSMFNVVMELGRHPKILQRIHEEIDETFEKNNGQLTYNAISEMEYLDKVYNEGLRLHPPIGYLTRKCVKDTVLPIGNIKVDKGTRIITPLYEIHHDPKYYPNPEVFDPERFSGDSRTTGNDMSYMPFGKGSRICIGARYARLQAKAGLIYLLQHFTVNTIFPCGTGIKYRKDQVQVRAINVNIELTPRDVTNVRNVSKI